MVNKSQNILYWSIAISILAVVSFIFIFAISTINQSVEFSNPSYPLTSSLLGGSGFSSVLTPIGNGITSSQATISNTTWIAFDGVNDMVHINDSLIYSNPFTVSFWINKTNNVDSTAGYIVCKATSTNAQRTFQFHTNSGNDIWFLVSHDGTTTNITTSQANNLLVNNTWYNVVGQWNGTSTKLYLNGLLIDSDVNASGNNIVFDGDGTANLTFGNCQSNSGFYNGSLDEVQTFNRVLTTSEINDLYLSGRSLSIPLNKTTGYFDDFSSYVVGFDTVQPNWVPQYTARVNITTDGWMQLNYLDGNNSDRDLHVTLNRSEISRGIQNLSIKFNYKVIDCNSTFRVIEGISPIGASGYLYYADGDNFISFESKVNGTDSTCGSGNALFNMYKRVGGTTVALLNNQAFTFNISDTYNISVNFTKINTTNFNYSVVVSNTSFYVIGNFSTNITVGDVKEGDAFLLENAGAVTQFDNVNVTRPYYFSPSWAFWRLNENTGTTIYDFNSLEVIGSDSGASFVTDGVNVSLIANTDYTLDSTTGLFTLLNNNLAYNLLGLSWTYFIQASSNSDLNNFESNSSRGFLNLSQTFPIIGTILGIAILLIILISAVIYFITKLSLSPNGSHLQKSNLNFG